MNKDKIIEILNNKIMKGNWKLKDTLSGKSKTSYIGEIEDFKVFIKLESVNDALLRLAEMEIIPKILYADKKIIIQEFVLGNHPTIQWMVDNFEKITKLIHQYHTDGELKMIIKKSKYSNYDEILDDFIIEVKNWEKQVSDFSKDINAKQHLEKLINNKPKNIKDQVVPVHADPNISNFILKGEKVYLVDWDDILLSDPLRDIGQFAWNYIPKEKWDIFMHQCGLEMTQERKFRFFWWISIMQLFVGFWFYIYQGDKDAYNRYLKESIKVANEYLFC